MLFYIFNSSPPEVEAGDRKVEGSIERVPNSQSYPEKPCLEKLKPKPTNQQNQNKTTKSKEYTRRGSWGWAGRWPSSWGRPLSQTVGSDVQSLAWLLFRSSQVDLTLWPWQTFHQVTVSPVSKTYRLCMKEPYWPMTFRGREDNIALSALKPRFEYLNSSHWWIHLTDEERKVCVWMGVEGSRSGRLLFYTTTSYSLTPWKGTC